MGETPDQIRERVEKTRERLGEDLNRLEYRIQAGKDWRTWYARYPWAFVGAAFAGAFVVGWAVAPKRG